MLCITNYCFLLYIILSYYVVHMLYIVMYNTLIYFLLHAAKRSIDTFIYIHN